MFKFIDKFQQKCKALGCIEKCETLPFNSSNQELVSFQKIMGKSYLFIYILIFSFINIFLCRPPRPPGLKNGRMSASTSNLSSVDSRPIGRLQKVNADGTQVIELYRPHQGPFGFYIAKGVQFSNGKVICKGQFCYGQS